MLNNVLGTTFMLDQMTRRKEPVWGAHSDVPPPPPFVVPISPALQGKNPLYCIKCWEIQKREQLLLPQCCACAHCFDNTHEDLKYGQLMSIGKGQAYNKRQQFEERMRDLADQTQADFRQWIINMDPNQESPSFDGGFNAAVVRLYRCHLSRENRTN
jgi:hypothetical protein